ncbi:flippase-like domain-containing protein [Candidatus Woesearchaeota archaeon]|nr:flippase-like domain-containing protein [Candidatus Woesearchaeota archaeon]
MKNKSLKIVASIILLLLSYGYIIYKVLNFTELQEINFTYHYYTISDLILLLSIFILMILNLSLETIKWRLLIRNIQNIKFFTAFKAVLSGITLGIFTPNRIGDLGGRVLYLQKGKRTYGLLATGIGSFAQFLSTIIIGITGFILFLFAYPEKSFINPIFNTTTGMVLILVSLILIWIYFNIKNIKPFLINFSFFKTRENQLDYFSETNTKTFLFALLLSIFRYFIFSSQFFLLLVFFDINLSFIQAFISISLVYLFATIIPTTTLVELGIRGSLAIFFIGIFSNQVLGIVLSSFFLWLINIALPSIMGSIFFIKNRFVKE